MLPKQTDYKVGIYLCLSRDDERAGESLSIENQRRILLNYVNENDWTLYDEYVYDGISKGTSRFNKHRFYHKERYISGNTLFYFQRVDFFDAM